ncbi:hypothetical protein TNCV_2020221 [Trichonephila clavipes]|nr:hypothetical protein TNCV_2020221 [Trichonephila clavipes]
MKIVTARKSFWQSPWAELVCAIVSPAHLFRLIAMHCLLLSVIGGTYFCEEAQGLKKFRDVPEHDHFATVTASRIGDSLPTF